MGRRELHSAQAILDGARTVLLADNPPTIDIPHGAIRQFLITGTPPPENLRPLVERAIRAVLDARLPPRRTRTT